MHDPMVVAFEIPFPLPRRAKWYDAKPGQKRWTFGRRRRTNPKNLGEPVYAWWRPRGYNPQIAGRSYRMRSLVTVWHVEPHGHDSGDVCKHYRRWQGPDGEWHIKSLHAWKWHIHHWRLQWPGLQGLGRRMFERCEWCGGRSTKTHPVNVGGSWEGKSRHWWQAHSKLSHMGCSSASRVASTCICEVPFISDPHRFSGRGECSTCGKFWQSEVAAIGYRRAIVISGMPVKGTMWTWPREVNCHDIEKRLRAEREIPDDVDV